MAGDRRVASDIPTVVVRVPAKAIDGAANRAIIDALAVAIGVRRSSVTIRRGQGARVKHVEVSGDLVALLAAVKGLPLIE